ncbi:MAG: hypothetical protein FWC95_05220 [Defluviitaleaceae bacterium]|nr:hypothetical protein [Defluviitaleaceae bacterium]
MREEVWNEFVQEETSRQVRRGQMQARRITWGGYTMNFVYTVIGEPGESGFPLYIALHGGGNTTAAFNDSQFAHMQVYYRDSVPYGIYVAVRSITNTRADIHAAPESFRLYDMLIENFILFRNADPNRVYLMGFSAGAEYAIAPRIADRLAAVALSAGHHGWSSPINLMNLPFLGQVGALDTAFNRHTENAVFQLRLEELQAQWPHGYKHQVFIHHGRGHQITDNSAARELQRVYADNVAWMRGESDETVMMNTNSVDFLNQFTRDPLPAVMVWELSMRAPMRSVDAFYWLRAPMEINAGTIYAKYFKDTNTVEITTMDVNGTFQVLLNSLMLDFGKPVNLIVNGEATVHSLTPCEDIIRETTSERGDPNFQFSAIINVTVGD